MIQPKVVVEVAPDRIEVRARLGAREVSRSWRRTPGDEWEAEQRGEWENALGSRNDPALSELAQALSDAEAAAFVLGAALGAIRKPDEGPGRELRPRRSR